MSAIIIPAKADCHSEYVSRRCISADHHISGWEPERRQSASRCRVPHSALELCLQLEVAHEANEALAVDPREVSVVVKVMAIIMMANTPRRRMRGNCGVNMPS